MAAAFFDVDNTLMRGASLYHLARGMAAHRFFTRRQLRSFAWKQAKFLASGREIHKDLRSVTEAALGIVAGRSVHLVLSITEEIVDDILVNKLWPGTLALAHEHLNAGREVWLVTASPQLLADALARRIGLTGAIGTRVEVVDGLFTGRLSGAPLHGEAKAAAIAELGAERGLDLTLSTAYSDSTNDLPMLQVVGNAVVVNPDRRLRREAGRRGWAIVDHRRSRFLYNSNVPASPSVAAGAGLAAGLAAAAVLRKRER